MPTCRHSLGLDNFRSVEEYFRFWRSYSGDFLLQALIIAAQSGGLWEHHASVVPPVPLTVTAPRGGGVRPLEKLLPHCVVSVGGRARADDARPEALHLSRLRLAGGPAPFLFSVYKEPFETNNLCKEEI